MVKRITSIVIAILLILIAFFLLALAINHLFGSIEKIYLFVFQYEFEVPRFHMNCEYCFVHRLPEWVHEQIIENNLTTTSYAFENVYVCFIKNALLGLTSLLAKLVATCVLFSFGITLLVPQNGKACSIIKKVFGALTSLGIVIFLGKYIPKLFIWICALIRTLGSFIFGDLNLNFHRFMRYFFYFIKAPMHIDLITDIIDILFLLVIAAAVVLCLFIKPTKKSVEGKKQRLQKKLQKLEDSLSKSKKEDTKAEEKTEAKVEAKIEVEDKVKTEAKTEEKKAEAKA